MTSYRLAPRATAFISLCVMFPFFAFFWFVAAMFVLSRASGWPIAIVFLIVLPLFSWAMLRTIVAIRFRNDGVVEFRRVIGATTMSAREIRFLQGEWVDDTYNRTKVWQMTIGHAEGRISVSQFTGMREFVEQVRLYNPRAEISGIWPLGLEPGIRCHPGDPAPTRATRR